MYAREDALFELTDSLLCTAGPVKTLVELSFAAEHRRSRGGMYAALGRGDVEPERLSRVLSNTPIPKARDGRITLAVDVSNYLPPDANTSDQRLFCHLYGRGRCKDQFIPGRPYSFVAVLETGPTSWTALLDARRLTPSGDVADVTAAQLRAVVARLIDAGHWNPGDPRMLIVADAGRDVARRAHLLAGLPAIVVARVRADRVYHHRAQPDPIGKAGRATGRLGVLQDLLARGLRVRTCFSAAREVADAMSRGNARPPAARSRSPTVCDESSRGSD